VPLGKEPGQRGRVDGLDLAAERGERTAPERPKHVDVAPLARRAVRAELAEDHLAVPLQRGERRPDAVLGHGEPARHVTDVERTMRPRVPGDE
jgi:hypothetical protein